MNTKYALWMAYEASNHLNNMIDLLMDNVDLFELFSEIETAAEGSLLVEEAGYLREAARSVG